MHGHRNRAFSSKQTKPKPIDERGSLGSVLWEPNGMVTPLAHPVAAIDVQSLGDDVIAVIGGEEDGGAG